MANKKMASIIGGSAILVVAAVAAIAAVTMTQKPKPNNSAQSSSVALSTSSKSVQSICEPTKYPATCESELNKASGNGNATDLKSLIQLSFKVSIDRLKEAANHSSLLTAASNDPYSVEPLKTCNELFDYAMHDLQEAVDNVLGYDFSEMDKAVYDLKTWLTAANTYQENCLDEFQNATSDTAVSMKKALNTSMELTSNALAIVDKVQDLAGKFQIPSFLGGGSDQKRRLLSTNQWRSEGQRRLLQLTPLQMKPNVTVAQDGSGQFKTINEAVASLPRNNEDFVVLHIKAGVYNEKVLIEKNLNKLIVIGDGPEKTKVTGKLNVFFGHGIGTIQTASFAAVGPEFMAKDITFENTAGPEGHQAVAFRSQSDRSILLNCHILGYQDTLYTQTNHQFYKDCTITGTVDFIFGNAAAVFQNCILVARKPMAEQANMYTAHGSKEASETTALIFQNCILTAEQSLFPVADQLPTYLGRPWKPYARAIYMQSQIASHVHPDGWMSWVGSPDSNNTCFFAEVNNRGDGANTDKRVKWRGVKHLEFQDMQKYTVDGYFMQAPWVHGAGIPDLVTALYPTNLPLVAPPKF